MLYKIKNYFIMLFFISIIICECDSYDYGDINLDDNIDIIDVMLCVDIVFDTNNFFPLADLNFDNINNIFDIIIMIERILIPFELDIEFLDIDFNFSDLYIVWNKTNEYSFLQYNIYYANFLNNEEVLLYSTNDITDTSIVIENIILNEQNFFSIGLQDITGCELTSNQFVYELPFKDYLIGDNGQIEYTEFNIDDFEPSSECMSCHEDHYNEWFSSMHSYSMKSPLFFSYKNQVNSNHPNVGEKFCMQCHNPVSYLIGENTALYDNPNDFQNSDLDEVIKDGIGCDVCHTITGLSQTVRTENNLFANAEYKMYPLGNIKFGSIQQPEENNFHTSYYLPTYKSSQMCLPCHDLVIRDVEAEITFTEWSRFTGGAMFGGVSCQDCHMPLKDNGYHSHKFIGVDIDLDIPLAQNAMVSDVQELLETSATISFGVLGEEIAEFVSSGEMLNIPITIESNTAHSLPSGTSFNRQVWLEMIISNNDDIIFESGKVDNNEQLDFSDSNLLLFATYLYDNQGNVTSNVTDTHSMNNNALLAYGIRYASYEKLVPDNIDGTLDVSARLLFRPFDPDFIIEHHPEFINNLPIYEISSITKNIIIQ